jgi:hypothetical protein
MKCKLLPMRAASGKKGLDRELNPGPLAPKARIIPLDHQASFSEGRLFK